MTTLRVDDISVPSDARSFASDLAALGPDYEIQITVQESEWLPHAVEHIKVFIQTPLGVTTTAALSKEIVSLFWEWVKDRRAKCPAHDHKKLTIYGPDNKPVRSVTVKGEHVEDK